MKFPVTQPVVSQLRLETPAAHILISLVVVEPAHYPFLKRATPPTVPIPAQDPIRNIRDIAGGRAKAIGQVAWIDRSRVIFPERRVHVASRRGIVEDLHESATGGSALRAVLDHLGYGGRRVGGVEGHGASVGLHEAAVLDAVVGAGHVHVARGLLHDVC